MNTHNKIKPYVCGYEGCTARFAARSNARRHRNTHGKDFVSMMDASERAEAESTSRETQFVDPIIADTSISDISGSVGASGGAGLAGVAGGSEGSAQVVRWMPVNLPKRHHRRGGTTSQRVDDTEA